MRLQEWEATIQTIAHECNLDRNGERRVLVAGVKLEEEPNLRQPYQIDQIVREVMLGAHPRQPVMPIWRELSGTGQCDCVCEPIEVDEGAKKGAGHFAEGISGGESGSPLS